MNGLERKVLHGGGEQRFTSHHLGWTAYIPAVVGLLGMLPLTWAASMLNPFFAIAVLIVGGLLFLGNVLFLYSIELYADFDGIWIQRGLFPWSRGVYGVKWRDVDEATYATGFIPWLSGCYAVRISHRFTKASEIQLRHVHHGDQAVQLLNRLHQDVIELENSRGQQRSPQG